MDFFPKISYWIATRSLPPCLCWAPAGCSRVSRRRRPSRPPWPPPRDPGGQSRTCAAALGRCSRPPVGGWEGRGPRAQGPTASFSEKSGGPPPHRGRPCRPPSGRDGRPTARLVSSRPICDKTHFHDWLFPNFNISYKKGIVTWDSFLPFRLMSYAESQI